MILTVEDGQARRGELDHDEKVAIACEPSRPREKALDDTTEPAIQPIDLDAGVRSVGDVQFWLRTAPVDENCVRSVVTPATLVPRKAPQIVAVPIVVMDITLTLAVSDPDGAVFAEARLGYRHARR